MKRIRQSLFCVSAFLFSLVAVGEGGKLDLEELKKFVGTKHAYILGMYKNNPSLSNSHFLRETLEKEKLHKKTVREKGAEYSALRHSYIVDGIKLKLENSQQSRSIASIEENKAEKLIYKIPQYLGLTFFKRNDLKRTCYTIVKQARDLKAEGVAFFYPVHYSGGNSKDFFMPSNPKYGRDFAYETAQSPDKKALFKCLDRILESGLKINYIPHLESISSLASGGSQEWRMYSGIPLDDYYYYYSFNPLMQYLKSSKKREKLVDKLFVTFGAEIDNMVIGKPRSALKVVKQLRKDLAVHSGVKRKVPILLNTNGDFYHMWKIPQAVRADLSCTDLRELFRSIDYISPSMYGDKGHFKQKNNRLSLNETLEQYYKQFKSILPAKCQYVEKDFRSVDIGFGEFALDPSLKQNYADILKEPGRVKFVQYWNHSKWDHLGVYPENKAIGQKVRKQLVTD